MQAAVNFLSNTASEADIVDHLWRCDADFVSRLCARVDINDYAKTIATKATRFEAWSGGMLVGLVAAYCKGQENHIAYITSVSMLGRWTGRGLAYSLLQQCIEHARALGMRQISLEVASDNTSAIKLYEKTGFVAGVANAPFVRMNLDLKILPSERGRSNSPRG